MKTNIRNREYVNDDFFYNKNFRNNQNYIINKKIINKNLRNIDGEIDSEEKKYVNYIGNIMIILSVLFFLYRANIDLLIELLSEIFFILSSLVILIMILFVGIIFNNKKIVFFSRRKKNYTLISVNPYHNDFILLRLKNYIKPKLKNKKEIDHYLNKI